MIPGFTQKVETLGGVFTNIISMTSSITKHTYALRSHQNDQIENGDRFHRKRIEEASKKQSPIMLLLAAKPESLENAAAGNVPRTLRDHLTVHARMSAGITFPRIVNVFESFRVATGKRSENDNVDTKLWMRSLCNT